MNVTTLVVDDEPLARRRLATLIADVPWATPLGEACDGIEAVAAATRLEPQVVFLDIQMPERSGIEVARQLRQREPAPAVIFTTAHDGYAITAFELGAVDYLLKPFGKRRFLEALERARFRVHAREGGAALDRAISTFTTPAGFSPHDRIFVRDGNAVLPVLLRDIERIEASDDYATVHTAQRRYLVSLRISTLEERLPNPPFLRVHRSHIVNLDHVARLAGLDDSRFEVHMKTGTLVPVSRARSQEIRRRSR
jgi:two-component system, LytTR family, response regulator